jgi:hypothetical protein
MTDHYLETRVWMQRDSATAVLYRCFKNLATGKFAVQSADFFRLPMDDKQLLGSEKQFIELFIETAPSKRCDWFDSVEEAIGAHNQEFI